MGYKVEKGVAAREINGTFYIVLPDAMKLIKLNRTGSLIFGLICNNTAGKVIEKKLSARYGISYKKAKKDLSGFIKELKKSKIIH